MSPAEQFAGALLDLSYDIFDNNSRRGPPGVLESGPPLDPYDVAMVLMKAEHQHRMMNLYKCLTLFGTSVRRCSGCMRPRSR
jgi:hypothetical protein